MPNFSVHRRNPADIEQQFKVSGCSGQPAAGSGLPGIFRTTVALCAALLLFVSSASTAWGASWVFASLLKQRQIVTFIRDSETGLLERLRATDCPAEPAFLAAAEDGRFLFVSLRSSGQLAAFRIDPGTGHLSLINVVEGGDDPAFLLTDRSGKFLLTAYYVSNKVTVHGISADGQLSEAPLYSITTADNAHGIAIDSKNRSVYVTHTGANRIDQFRFDVATGHLTPLDPPFVKANPGQHPRHIVLHPSDRWAWCSNEAGSSDQDGASMYTRDADTLQLNLQQSVSSLPDDADATQNSTSRCLMTPDGRFLYVANRGHNSLAGFAIDQASGSLHRISVTPTEAIPRSFTITGDGRHLYAAGEASGRVAGYRILDNGELELLATVESGPVSWAVVAVDTPLPAAAFFRDKVGMSDGTADDETLRDRRVAEWVLLQGGSVRLEGSGARIRAVTDLPPGNFYLELIDLVGTNILPPDLKWLESLSRLRVLNLPGPMWNPSSGAEINYSTDLGKLAGLRSLEELTFSYTYLESIKFDDDGIQAITPLGPALRMLSLENTNVRGQHLAAFTSLESLDLAYCPVNDAGLQQMQQLTKLRRLLLRDALITDAGMEYLSNLKAVEHLDLGGTAIGDRGIAHLAEMASLRKLSLRGTALTDSGIRHLLQMTELEELDLYGTRITNAGVDTLKELGNLRMVDLRYTRASQSGAETLAAAIPPCEVVFVDLAMRPAIPEAANRMVAGHDDAAVARWVRDTGGRATMQNGRLTDVSLANTSVRDELLENLSGLRHLQRLELQFTEISDLGIQQLSEVSSLRDLDLSGTMISDEGLSQLSGLNNLQQLQLTHTQLAGSGFSHLHALPLRELNLAGSNISDQGLTQLKTLMSLRNLSLAYSDITDDGLIHLQELHQLRRLDLAGTDIGDRGLRHLGTMTDLTELLLSYTRITDTGIVHLASLTQLTELGLIRTRVTDKSMPVIAGLSKLVSLNLDYTDVSDKGLEALGQLTELRELSLDSTEITDKIAGVLSRFLHLQTLNLYHTLFTQPGYQQIRDALPECRIIWDPLSADPSRRRS